MEKKDVIKAHKDELTKYTYYVVGLCVASIGFAVSDGKSSSFSRKEPFRFVEGYNKSYYSVTHEAADSD